MNISLHQIRSISDALKQIANIDVSQGNDTIHPLKRYWYRGEAEQYTSKLIPKAFRKASQGLEEYLVAFHREQSLLLYFQNEFMNELPLGSSCLDWLSFSQHHSLPTRLLDFSRNLLVALYFATEIDINNPSEGSLFILNPILLNSTSVFQSMILGPNEFSANLRAEMSRNYCLTYFVAELTRRYSEQYAREYLSGLIENCQKSNSDIELPSAGHLESILKEISHYETKSLPALLTPVAFLPRIFTERMKRQTAAFVIYGGGGIDNVFFNPITLVELNTDNHFLTEFIIDRKDKQSIRDELEVMGIHMGSIFPEPEFTARYLSSFHKI